MYLSEQACEDIFRKTYSKFFIYKKWVFVFFNVFRLSLIIMKQDIHCGVSEVGIW